MAEHAHITPAPDVATTARRNLFTRAAAATLLIGGASAAPAISPHPDAASIHLARAVESEARLWTRTATHGFGFDTPEAEAIEAQLDVIGTRQAELVDDLLDMPVTTLAGLQAVAAALVAVDDELMNEARTCDNERMMRHLVKSLLALQVRFAKIESEPF